MNKRMIDPLPDDHHERSAFHAAQLMRSQVEAIHGQSTGRPDPAADRAAYEAWYHSLADEHKQAEWNLFHAQNQPVQPQNITMHQQPQQPSQPTWQHAQHSAVETPQPMQHAMLPAQQMPEPVHANPQPHTRRRTHNRRINPFRSLLTAGALAIVFSFLFYNELVIGQVRSYISPNSEVSSPIILDPSLDIDIGPETRIIIPKINVDVPIVDDLESLEESAIQDALDRGVVDYKFPGTVDPGQIGNNVIVGHSSNNFLNSGQYKFAFVLLERLEEGDTFIIHSQGTRYVYRVTNRQVVEPTDFSLITQTTDKPIATLITCTPPGTAWKRFILQGEQISPSPATAENVSVPVDTPEIETSVPGNAPSLWSRIF